MSMEHTPNQSSHHDLMKNADLKDTSSCESMCLTPEVNSCCSEATSHCASAFVGAYLALKTQDLDSDRLQLGRCVAQLQARISSFDPPPPKS